METATVSKPATDAATGSKTLADLLPAAVAKHGPNKAVIYKEGSEWVSKTYDEVGEIIRNLVARADGPRDREGRQGRAALQHAPRVDLLRLRRALGRRHRRPDLPDELTRRVPVRARELRRRRGDRRGRRAAREGPPRPRPLPAARARDPDDRRVRRRDLASTSSPPAAPMATPRPGRSATARSRPTTSARSSTRRERPGRRRAA